MSRSVRELFSREFRELPRHDGKTMMLNVIWHTVTKMFCRIGRYFRGSNWFFCFFRPPWIRTCLRRTAGRRRTTRARVATARGVLLSIFLEKIPLSVPGKFFYFKCLKLYQKNFVSNKNIFKSPDRVQGQGDMKTTFLQPTPVVLNLFMSATPFYTCFCLRHTNIFNKQKTK